MNIGIDIDGTLTDEHGYMIKKALEYIKRENLNFKIEDESQYYTIDVFNWGEKHENEFWDEYIFDYAKNIKVYDDVVRVIKKLKENNKIIIITSRGFTTENTENGKIMRSLVEKWLKDNEIPYDEIIYAKHGKVEECKKSKLDVIIEDSAYNMECLKGIVKNIICFDAPYNKDVTNVIRCKNWNEIEKVFESKKVSI